MNTLRISAAIGLVLYCSGCGDSTVQDTTLAELAADPGYFDGQRVQVAGLLRSYPEPLHFWIEDRHLNRVEVVFDEDLNRWMGQRVKVRGRFSYKPSVGRRIAAEQLIALTTPDDPRPQR